MKKFIIVFFLMFTLVGICTGLTFPHKVTISDTNENEKNGYVDVFIRDNYAYCLSGKSGLDIIDISNPTSPVRKGRFDTTAYADAREVFVNSNYAYIANTGDGVKIIDVSNPSSPGLVGAYDPYSDAYESVLGVYISGDYAYLADWYFGLHIIYISNPGSPFFFGLYDTPGQAIKVDVKGNYAYVADGYGGLQVVNISNPASPIPEGGYTSPNHPFVSSVFVRDNYAYIIDSDLNDYFLRIIDVSKPYLPILTGSCGLPGTCRDVFTTGDHAYVTCADKGLQIINISTLSSPAIEGSYQTTGEAGGVYVKDNYAYIADESEGLIILDISTPSAPQLMGKYNPTQQPLISLNRTHLNFGAVIPGEMTASQEFLINNSGKGVLNWVITDNVNWLNYSSQSGQNSALVTVTVDPTGLPVGLHQATISISDGNAGNSPQTIEVTLNIYYPYTSDVPFGVFATPVDGSTVSSSIPVTGWALDDVGVDSVKIYRVAGKNLIYIGDAVFVQGARPDVEQAYPDYPNNYRAGWGYMLLTNFVFLNQGDGTFTLQAIALDKEGNTATLGSKTITIDNANAVKPFGAMDTPDQGGTASGSNFVNWGWVLTPQPNKIPEDGSTINVYVDGVMLGHPTYNIYRSDVAALFPNYANSNGAIGFFYLDTTTYENGVHTIQWTATDNVGNTDGIGSRYFTIENSGTSGQQALVNGNKSSVNSHWLLGDNIFSSLPDNYDKPIRIKKGYNEDIELREIYPDDSGALNIGIREMERIEIYLGFPDLIGFQVIGDQLKPLPIGSFIDREIGIFYWQPGVGFYGIYEFVFIKKDGIDCRKVSLRVRILPKHPKL
ncbi:Ig-like domain-containing protein [Acidobacteriota bacterium]